MGTAASKPKRRTLWDDFCENCSALLERIKVSFKNEDNSHPSTNAGYSPLVAASSDEEHFERRLDDAVDNLLTQSTYAKVSENIPEQRVSVIPENSQDNQPAFSTATVIAAQESVKPVTLYKAGLGCLTLAGFTSMIALGTGIYPLFAIAGLLAVLGTALLITAYALNDEKKDGSLFDQTFSKFFENLPTIPISQFSPQRSN